MEFDFEQGPFTGMSGPSAVDEFPDILTYADVSDNLWDIPESEFLLGVDGAGDPVTVDLASDSPHVIVSAGSGGGKSVIAASLATQALVKGASVAVFDVKRISHRWAKSLPGVSYGVTVDEIANGLVSVAAEVHRRMKIIEQFPGPVSEAPVGPRILVVAEELNTMMGALADFERTLPRRGVYYPTRAFADIMNLGRAAKVHVLAFAQYPDHTVVPKRLMESFGYRLLIRHKPESWRMLAWQLGYCPPAPQHPGRGFTVTGDKGIQTQYLYLPEELCADLVRRLRPSEERATVRGAVRELKRVTGQWRALREIEGR